MLSVQRADRIAKPIEALGIAVGYGGPELFQIVVWPNFILAHVEISTDAAPRLL
jgi:hypothetical protein